MSLSRNQKRVIASKLSKKYGLSKDYSLKLHDASLMLSDDKVSSAVNLALNVAENNPNNIHAWLLLGEAALKILDYSMAKVFYGRVLEIDNDNSDAKYGLAVAHYLNAEIDEFQNIFEDAFPAIGPKRESSLNLYLDLVIKKNEPFRFKSLVETFDEPKSDIVNRVIGETLFYFEEFDLASSFFKSAYSINNKTFANQFNYLRHLVFSFQYDKAIKFAQSIYGKDKNKDDSIISFILMSIRNLKRYADISKFYDAHEFNNIDSYVESLMIMGNIYQDQGDYSKMDSVIEEVLSIKSDLNDNLKKSIATYWLRDRKLSEARDFWNSRLVADRNLSRAMTRLTNVIQLNSEVRSLYIVTEQGMGDYLAFSKLVRIFSKKWPDISLKVIARGRSVNLFKQLHFIDSVVSVEDFPSLSVDSRQDLFCYLGDFIYLVDDIDSVSDEEKILEPDMEAVGRFRSKYRNNSSGLIIGISWKTKNNLSSTFRSVNFEELLESLPDGSIAVSLQYGDVSVEREVAKKKFPNLKVIFDEDVDQMADMIPFINQVAAMDAVITIDNTAAHVCGAIGHNNTHVLTPNGSECMWYWTRKGTIDPWYGKLYLHRQDEVGIWGDCLRTINTHLQDI